MGTYISALHDPETHLTHFWYKGGRQLSSKRQNETKQMNELTPFMPKILDEDELVVVEKGTGTGGGGHHSVFSSTGEVQSWGLFWHSAIASC
jgi:hypothetical protein